jgi:hypothetical protein
MQRSGMGRIPDPLQNVAVMCLPFGKPRPQNWSRKDFPEGKGHIQSMPSGMRKCKGRG